MLAILKTGGKQYLVKPGDKIKIDPPSPRLSAGLRRAGKIEEQKIIFNEILLLEKNKKLEIGQPFIKGAKLTAKVLRQGKGKKVIVFKYKPKTRYKKKTGHRQPFSEVAIDKF